MSLRLCNNANSGLKLNESLSNNGEYILEGVFAELGVMNVNHRIYTEDEYLKHLQYLREDVAKGDLLGELDHPDERFEVKMEGVSHQIIDIWYDQPNKMVMGKIKLLNTPKGQIAKAVVDAGIPLHISSRAAGTINKDNTVSIQQIYTYDIVAKPGFAKATLHRVNESAAPLSADVKSFLERSELFESKNASDDVIVNNLEASVNLRKEAIEINEGKSTIIDMEKLTKHILNEDEEQKKDAALGVSTPSMDPVKEADGDDEEKKGTEESKPEETDKKEETGDDNKEEKKESDAPYEVISAKVVSSESDDDNKDDEKEDDKEEDNKEEGEEDNKDDEKKDNEETSECGTVECACGDKKKNPIFDANEKSKDAVKKADAGLSKIDELISELKKKKQPVNDGVKESLRQNYPFTAYLNESDLAQFSGLTDEQKSRVKKYLLENNVVSYDGVQRLWKNGLNENAKAEPVWLRYASQEYRKLYESASEVEKQNLQETAQFIIFENQHDVDVFWERSGLRTRRERQLLKESFLQNAPKVAEQAQRVYNELPYTKESLQVYLDMVD